MTTTALTKAGAGVPAKTATSTAPRYMGKVKAAHPGGYGFIGLDSVTREDGSPDHGLATKIDIYVHAADAKLQLKKGQQLTFEVIDDPTSRGRLKAVNVREVVTAIVVPSPEDSPIVPAFVLVSPVHGNLALPLLRDPRQMVKPVPPELLAKVIANKPFDGLPRDGERVAIGDNPMALEVGFMNYLTTHFPGLQSIGYDYRVVGFDHNTNEAKLQAALEEHAFFHMTDQSNLLTEEHEKLVATRALLIWIINQGWLRSGTELSPTVLKTLLKAVEGGDSDLRNRLSADAQATIGFMRKHDILSPCAILPMQNLLELFCAMPVWYHVVAPGTPGLQIDGDWRHRFDHKRTGWFHKRFTKNWRELYLLFNRNRRLLGEYQGEQIPTSLMRLMREATGVFDHVIVMTPYHDVALRDWQAPSTWQRPYDPMVIGIKEGLPFVFCLGRFSEKGIFPGMDELIADTVNFLSQRKDAIAALNQFDGIWAERESYDGSKKHGLGARLQAHVDTALAAFEAGTLFDWLKKWD